MPDVKGNKSNKKNTENPFNGVQTWQVFSIVTNVFVPATLPLPLPLLSASSVLFHISARLMPNLITSDSIAFIFVTTKGLAICLNDTPQNQNAFLSNFTTNRHLH